MLQQERVPRGVPTGGRFAQTTRTENDTRLLADHTDAPAGDPPGATDLGPARLLASARSAVEHWAKAKTTDPRVPVRTIHPDDLDDLAQDAIVDALRSRSADTTGPTWRWVNQMAHNAVVAALRGGVSPVDSKARKLLADQVYEREQALGRSLTDTEVNDAAAKMRDMWADQRHRPSAGFHHAVPDPEVATGQLPDVPTPDQQSAADPHPALKQAITVAERPGSKSAARLMAWDAIAAKTGAPQALRAHTARKATTIRATVAAAGGVGAVLDQWDAGEDTEATRALMVPFGDLDVYGEHLVVTMLRSQPNYAEELWDSAARVPRR